MNKKLKITSKPDCKYGSLCYRKNADHYREYNHPSDQTLKPGIKAIGKVQVQRSPKRKLSEHSEIEPDSEVSQPEKNPSAPSLKQIKLTSDIISSLLEDREVNIKEKFLVEMPKDFYKLWDFCCSVNKKQPAEIFSELGIHLVGPYDILSKKITDEDITGDNILRHWRYFYDPPEFQTVIMQDGDECYHIGYFRDDPSEMPFGVASNSASIGPKFKLMGDNIFSALCFTLKASLSKVSTKSVKDKFSTMLGELKAFAKKNKFGLEVETKKTKARQKKVLAKTFHGFGMVVPYKEESDVGYRPLSETNEKLKSILKNIAQCETEATRLRVRAPLDDLITNIQFANDECDFGMGLELGLDLFSFGETCLHHDILMVLPLAYDLLRRSEYGRILKAHLQNRKKGFDLSIKKD